MTTTAVKKRTPKPVDFVPVAVFPEGHSRAGRRQCQAWNPNAGRQCEQYPLTEKTKCRSHGGATPRGLASPHFKGGKYVGLPDPLADGYRRSLEDPDLLQLKNEIALMDARLLELTEGLAEAESESTWNEIGSEIIDLMKSLRGRPRDYYRAELAAVNLERLYNQGGAYWRRWREIYDALEIRRRLTESERKRSHELFDFVPGDHLRIMVFQFYQSVVEITNPNAKQRNALAESIRRFIPS